MTAWNETDNKIRNLIHFINSVSDAPGPLKPQEILAQTNTSLLEIQRRDQELCMLLSIIKKIHEGNSFENIMEYIYESFHRLIPYDRIGVALINHEQETISSRWARLRTGVLKLDENYTVFLKHSSLGEMAKKNSPEPRILNDLEAYFRDHPHSISTRKILAEGIRSSLTCPIIASKKTIGFIFFSSFKSHTYQKEHVQFYLEIADQVSIALNHSLMTEKLLLLNTVKDDFVNMVSHELRTPLAIIQEGTAQVLDRIHGDITPGQERSLQSAFRNIKHLGRIINDLLDVSKMENGKIELLEESFELIELFKVLIESCKPQAEIKGLELREVFEVPSLMIHADRDRVTQVFINLLNNAIQYTEKGWIEIRVFVVHDSVNCSIRDTGIGITEDHMKKLFRKFDQFGRRSYDHHRGTGLGLSIVKNIVELHGGTVQAESRLGEGSCFTVSFPHRSFRLLLEKKLSHYLNQVGDGKNHSLFFAYFSFKPSKKPRAPFDRTQHLAIIRDLRQVFSHTVRQESDFILCSAQEIFVAFINLSEASSLAVQTQLQEIIHHYLKVKDLLDVFDFNSKSLWNPSGNLVWESMVDNILNNTAPKSK